MTTRNFSSLFQPRTIALVGASNAAGSVGAVVGRNLLAGGFAGEIWMVNPRETEILSQPCYNDIADLPAAPDLAVIATPPATVPGLVAALGDRGCRAAIVITAGLDRQQRSQMLEAARPHVMRIVGPNCLGMLSPAGGINASFSHLAPLAGDVAFVTQSGAIATSIIDWANGRGVGFSHILSLGDMSDVDFGDLLDYLALDSATRSILLYAESITQARKFMSAARIAARAKPVLVVKGGSSRAGAKAAASHTGAMAGADEVYSAAFRRAGMLRVNSLRDLFDAAETLASGLRPEGDRLIVLTNGGGLGVLATDALERRGGTLATLSEAAMAKLDAALPRAWSHGNPVDILGDAHGARYEAALSILNAEACDAILVMNCPTGVSNSGEAADAVINARAKHPGLPWLGCWMGEATAAAPRLRLSDAGVPNYETPDEAAAAFLTMVEFRRNQEALLQAPSASAQCAPDARELVRAVLTRVLSEGRDTLTEIEAKRVLAAYKIATVETVSAASPEEAAEAAARFAKPVALKILSRQITHKTDVGGVRLNLQTPEAVRAAALEMQAAVTQAAPHARIDGFTVQPMIRRPRAHELIVGAADDPTFGPCLLFGQGGVNAELVADRSMELPPLNSELARALIARTRVSKLFGSYRGRPAVDVEAIAATLVSLSDLVVDFAEIAELDINPLLADEDGVIALDARIILRPSERTASERLAIRPYPVELAKAITVDGRRMHLRPIRPQDAPALAAMLQRSEVGAGGLPLRGGDGVADEHAVARVTQIDYDREMALVALDDGGRIAGLARLLFNPEFDAAELALIVSADAQGQALRQPLLDEATRYARSRGAAIRL